MSRRRLVVRLRLRQKTKTTASTNRKQSTAFHVVDVALAADACTGSAVPEAEELLLLRKTPLETDST